MRCSVAAVAALAALAATATADRVLLNADADSVNSIPLDLAAPIRPVDEPPQRHSNADGEDRVDPHALWYGEVGTGGVCEPVFAAVRDYRSRIVEPFAWTGNASGGHPIRYRVMAAERSGFGSNQKGVATMLLVAMFLDVPLILQSDCPQLGRFYESDVAYIDPAVWRSTPFPRKRCEYAIGPFEEPALQKADDSMAKLKELLYHDATDSIYCDRHLIHLFLKNKMMVERFLAPKGLDRFEPMDLSGCLLRAALRPSRALQRDLDTAMRPYTMALQQAHGDADKPVLLGIQARIGGKKVKWEDPDRVSAESYDRVLTTALRLIKKFVAAGKDAEAALGRPGHPLFFVFITCDSEEAYNSMVATVPKDRRIEFMPHLFSHTARSYRLDADVTRISDHKVVSDFTILERSTLHLVARSGFGEMPAWMGATRRKDRTFPAWVAEAGWANTSATTIEGLFDHAYAPMKMTDCGRTSC